jgi:hypothetical protein
LRGRYFRSDELERLADDLLSIYQQKSGSPLRPPIQADLVAESVGLDILWEEIREEPGTTVCAEIRPEERLIVMNERRRELLESTPGLYNTTVAHELGHWWLHVDHAARDHSSLPDLIYSSAPLREGDERDKRDERNAGEFMGYLLMPRSLLIPRLDGLDLQNWRNLYYLRDAFGVTISTVRVRLEKMRLTYLDSAGRFHKSDQEAGGQGALF